MTGPADQRLIVFLHGMGQSPQSWQDQVVALPIGTRAVAPWVYGMRPGRNDTFTLVAAADDVARTLDLQGVERAIVCGVSLGARVALEFAVRHPDRVDRVVAAGPPARLPWLARASQRLATRLVPRSVYANQGIDKAKVVAAGGEVGRIAAYTGVEEITAPVLLVVGSKDAAGVATARTLDGRIANAEVRVIDGAGHLVNAEAPDEFNRAVADFVAE